MTLSLRQNPVQIGNSSLTEHKDQISLLLINGHLGHKGEEDTPDVCRSRSTG